MVVLLLLERGRKKRNREGREKSKKRKRGNNYFVLNREYFKDYGLFAPFLFLLYYVRHDPTMWISDLEVRYIKISIFIFVFRYSLVFLILVPYFLR